MLKVYSSYNCSSCKKSMAWLRENGIGFEEFNFFSRTLTEDEIRNMLKYAKNGFEDVISERSKVYENNKEEIQNMSTKTLINFIIDNPAILKRPIIVDHVMETMLVGYNENDMNDLI